ncbi:type VI secretion system Vgr family protein, partial [Pseudoduganella namucuonensis]
GRPVSPAGTVRYHRDSPTEQRDAVTAWSAVRTLRPASVGSHSWDYKLPTSGALQSSWVESGADQGWYVKGMAASLDDYQVETPHAADGENDKRSLGQARMKRHDYEAKCFHGEGSVRDLCVGENFTLAGHPEIDTHPLDQRHFTVTALTVAALNNLPKALAARVERLFARNRWLRDGADGWLQREMGEQISTGPVRMHIHFTAVRRDTHIVPAYDPRVDLPQPKLQSAIVVGPQGEEVHCDELGRVKIRFPGTRAKDHAHASGTGASDSDIDSAWVRVASNWAGNGPGSRQQCGTIGLPRVGTEVLVDFLGGDPDRPVVVGQLYNAQGKPAALSSAAGLPDTRHLSGIKSREVRGGRANQLRFDDTPGEISAQLSSDHGRSELNLGFLTEPRSGLHNTRRGQGAELRSDHAVAVRGAEGVLITASSGGGAKGQMLERDELLRLAEGLQKMAEDLSNLAVQVASDEPCGPALKELVQKLKDLHDSGSPVVALSGPAGVAIGSTKNVAMAAATDIDFLSAQTTNLYAGSTASVRAAKGASILANEGGVKVTAAAGKVTVQALDDQMDLVAQKVLEIISNTDWINLKAKHGVRINGGGTELELSAAGIKGYTSGNHHMHAADHQTFPAQKKPLPFPAAKPRHKICVPCLLIAASAHSPFALPK